MTLLSLNGTVPGDWGLLEKNEAPTEGANVAVPLARFLSAKEEFFVSAGAVGVLIDTETSYTDLAPLVNKLSFVAINFLAFTDGRGFSLAVRLRKDLGFKGEIRATGHAIPDQALFLLRAGFDTADVADERKEAFENALSRFNSFYQADYQGRASVAHQRHTQSEEQRKAS
tara:strand:+ start:970 stop:1482 length:513 start_codon:yes stop_codon:yes gene_type:complete